jgi:hypothetical protein
VIISRYDRIQQPDLPFLYGVGGEAFRLALEGITPKKLAALAKSNGVTLHHVMSNLRKGSRRTAKRIGKRGWQWDLLETPTEVRVVNLRRTPKNIIGTRKS